MVNEFVRQHKSLFYSLGLGLIFGLAAGAFLFARLHSLIPGTQVVTDPREVFLCLGAALAGLPGAIVAGALAGYFTPTPEIRWFSLLTHTLSGIWISLAYTQVYRQGKLLFKLLSWALVLLVNYGLVMIPFAILLPYLLDPNGFNFLFDGLSLWAAYERLLVALIPEYFFTWALSSVVLIALPGPYLRPVWKMGGKPE